MRRIPEPEYMDIEEEAAAYAAADFDAVNAAFVHAVLEFSGTRAAPRVLDLGSGPGDIPQQICQMRPNWRVVGVDASRAMLRCAMRRKSEYKKTAWLRYVQCDAKKLPFPAHCFDIVISNSILHHIADVHNFWIEIRRVTKSQGALFLRDLARPSDEKEAARLVQEYSGKESPLLQEEFYRSLLAAYTPDEVQRQLHDADLPEAQVLQVTDRHLDVRCILP